MLADSIIDHWLVEGMFVPDVSMPSMSYSCCLLLSEQFFVWQNDKIAEPMKSQDRIHMTLASDVLRVKKSILARAVDKIDSVNFGQ